MSPHKIEDLPSAAALPSYSISKNGFLPASPPLTRLPSEYYQPWESIIEVLPALIETRQIRQRVDELPVLSAEYLETEAEWQRAYSMLAVITQGYVWQGPEPSERLPPCISIPFLAAAERLEVHPIATYAALNLWNWRPLSKGANITLPDNLVALHTATGSDDESWFLIISNAMEARAGPLLHILLAAMEAVSTHDVPAIVSGLRYFTAAMADIGALLERMDERCEPKKFYYTIRPLLAGSMNMEAAGLPRGVFYDEGNGKGEWRKYRGGSNGQSSLLQFFDAALSVSHTRCGDFHAEMRGYMPGPHKRFLDDIEAIANIRSYVDAHQEDTELLGAYNEAVAALSRFRDIHIALVTRFIIIPARQGRPSRFPERNDIASMSTKMAAEKGQTQELVGTGGTKLIPFLRTSRDETKEATVS
ncbi:hypothetical protein SLS61_002712 [Didymella pomorum]